MHADHLIIARGADRFQDKMAVLGRNRNASYLLWWSGLGSCSEESGDVRPMLWFNGNEPLELSYVYGFKCLC